MSTFSLEVPQLKIAEALSRPVEIRQSRNLSLGEFLPIFLQALQRQGIEMQVALNGGVVAYFLCGKSYRDVNVVGKCYAAQEDLVSLVGKAQTAARSVFIKMDESFLSEDHAVVETHTESEQAGDCYARISLHFLSSQAEWASYVTGNDALYVPLSEGQTRYFVDYQGRGDVYQTVEEMRQGNIAPGASSEQLHGGGSLIYFKWLVKGFKEPSGEIFLSLYSQDQARKGETLAEFLHAYATTQCFLPYSVFFLTNAFFHVSFEDQKKLLPLLQMHIKTLDAQGDPILEKLQVLSSCEEGETWKNAWRSIICDHAVEVQIQTHLSQDFLQCRMKCLHKHFYLLYPCQDLMAFLPDWLASSRPLSYQEVLRLVCHYTQRMPTEFWRLLEGKACTGSLQDREQLFTKIVPWLSEDSTPSFISFLVSLAPKMPLRMDCAQELYLRVVYMKQWDLLPVLWNLELSERQRDALVSRLSDKELLRFFADKPLSATYRKQLYPFIMRQKELTTENAWERYRFFGQDPEIRLEIEHFILASSCIPMDKKSADCVKKIIQRYAKIQGQESLACQWCALTKEPKVRFVSVWPSFPDKEQALACFTELYPEALGEWIHDPAMSNKILIMHALFARNSFVDRSIRLKYLVEVAQIRMDPLFFSWYIQDMTDQHLGELLCHTPYPEVRVQILAAMHDPASFLVSARYLPLFSALLPLCMTQGLVSASIAEALLVQDARKWLERPELLHPLLSLVSEEVRKGFFIQAQEEGATSPNDTFMLYLLHADDPWIWCEEDRLIQSFFTLFKEKLYEKQWKTPYTLDLAQNMLQKITDRACSFDPMWLWFMQEFAEGHKRKVHNLERILALESFDLQQTLSLNQEDIPMNCMTIASQAYPEVVIAFLLNRPDFHKACWLSSVTALLYSLQDRLEIVSIEEIYALKQVMQTMIEDTQEAKEYEIPVLCGCYALFLLAKAKKIPDLMTSFAVHIHSKIFAQCRGIEEELIAFHIEMLALSLDWVVSQGTEVRLPYPLEEQFFSLFLEHIATLTHNRPVHRFFIQKLEQLLWEKKQLPAYGSHPDFLELENYFYLLLEACPLARSWVQTPTMDRAFSFLDFIRRRVESNPERLPIQQELATVQFLAKNCSTKEQMTALIHHMGCRGKAHKALFQKVDVTPLLAVLYREQEESFYHSLADISLSFTISEKFLLRILDKIPGDHERIRERHRVYSQTKKWV